MHNRGVGAEAGKPDRRRLKGRLKARPRPSAAAQERLAAGVGPAATLRTFVHDMVNPLSAIQFATSALRTSKVLTARELADVRRMERATGIVVQMVERLATMPEATITHGADSKTIDLYVLCCELAARRQSDERPIHCRAFGDPRGRWDRRRLVRIVSSMLDHTTAQLGKGSMMSIVVTGVGRHVRLDVHALGSMSPKGRHAFLDFPDTVEDKLGGTLTATVSPTAGTIFTLRLPR
jgi:signal transduction histidine kinase